jgi:SEC-C motif-containing protein
MKNKKQSHVQSEPCPCGRGPFAQCCQPHLEQHQHAQDAESLMRSRYTAYSLGHSEYIQRTWHPRTRPQSLDLSEELQQGQWIGLSVKRHENTAENTAIVEFIACYKPKGGGAVCRMHEQSRFVYENEQWFYVEGDQLNT